nr:porin [uncultured Bacteroides sp.]
MKRILLTVLAVITLSSIKAQEEVQKVINTLKERITLSGYAHAGYTYDDSKEVDNTFEIKRIIFMAHGQITKEWSCYFMYNFNGGGNLLEMYTDYQFLPGLTARLGQFKTAYGIENQMSLSDVELINCGSLATNYLAGMDNSDKLYGSTGGRDAGVMIYGDLFQKLISYNLGVMNGQGINIKDQNNHKDIVGSLMANPLKWLSVGGSFVKGKGCAVATSSINPDLSVGDSYTRNRWALGAVIKTKSLNLRTEYMGGKDGEVKSDGFYATANFHVLPKIDLIASYDYLNRDKRIADKQTDYVTGVQYWFYPRCRLQAQYTFCNKTQQDNSNLIQAQVQVRF